jgi:hypothetical protein
VPDEAQAVAQTVTRFLDAAEAGRFDEVEGLLSADWRDRYSAARLQADFEAEPLVKERLARVRKALQHPSTVEGTIARLALGGGRSLRAVKEAQGWRIAALEE